MREFINMHLMYQQMTLKVATSMMLAVMETNLRLLQQHASLFDHTEADHRQNAPHTTARKREIDNPTAKKRSPHGRRGGKYPSPCCGPDLQDHYGKRAHDVDVEHL